MNRILNRCFSRFSKPFLVQYEPDRTAQRIRDLRNSGSLGLLLAISGSNVRDTVGVDFAVGIDGKGIALIQRMILNSR